MLRYFSRWSERLSLSQRWVLYFPILMGPLVASLTSCTEQSLPVGGAETVDKSALHTGRCRHVVDGDSLYLQGTDPQIRLWGVDAPERDEAGYQQAKDALHALAKGKQLSCERVDIDKYQRIVARCYLPDGREINEAMLDSGLADEYCRFTRNHYGRCKR